MDRCSPILLQGHSKSFWLYFSIGAFHEDSIAVGPIMNPRYLPSVAHVYCGVFSVVVSGGLSPSAMAMVLVRLMSIVVMLLYVDINLWSFLECLDHDGMTAAVSSAKVLMCACGNFFPMILSKLSVAMAKISGDSGQPCLIPRVASNWLCVCPLSRICGVLLL